MSVIAFLPARFGSKSIPRKNIKSFCGKPLIFWNLKELQKSNVDEIIVATDHDEIKDIVNSFNFSKVTVYDRNPKNARDVSSTESVMLEYIIQSNHSDSDIFILVQATSPFTQTHHFNEGLELFKSYDSVLSCTISKKFIWSEDGTTLSYDISNRPRRQDYKGNLIENGAFYINSISSIKTTKNRIAGNIGVYTMPDYTNIEIDHPSDWLVGEALMRQFNLIFKTIYKFDIFRILYLF